MGSSLFEKCHLLPLEVSFLLFQYQLVGTDVADKLSPEFGYDPQEPH